MAQDLSRGQLCTVCAAHAHKYRCPRCPAVRTCSLSCYKRHQSRASCNGQRSETNYVKKSQLVTAAGFDHDYNFLTKIERAIQTPPRTTADQVDERPHKRRKKAAMGGMEKYCSENAITLERAPEGFQRAKNNETKFFQRSKKVCWMVEWVDEQGSRTTSRVLEDTPLGEAYRYMKKEQKRLLRQETTTTHDAGKEVNASKECPQLLPVDVNTPGPTGSLAEQGSIAPTTTTPTDTGPDITVQGGQTRTDTEQPLNFYLHLPRCISRNPVLATLSETSTITQCLTQRRILEYPTVYVLPQPADSLPDTYMSEGAYRRQLQDDNKNVNIAEIVRSAAAEVGGRSARTDELHALQEERLDEKAILEMLKRDVNAQYM
ncbi:hypothetical protein CAC42_1728 [Sphaceloma murrayae]|uniref:HIT-type domain-containing protein n=1 Tax=Sphaceloma murrayae TaxID=2082308 RepID=A0A2K1QHR1_9PEZI|nr:hypothetical protein CAC42_1728 [Sphaceloma murrayae]